MNMKRAKVLFNDYISCFKINVVDEVMECFRNIFD